MIRRGELWRLLTDILPHGDVFHLAFNIYWLWIFGTVIERVFGHSKTIALIALLAIGSSSLEFAFAQGGIGLSGVVYGLFGFLWFLTPRDDRFRDVVDPRTTRLFVGWFFFCVLTTAMNVFPVANIAHAAGALVGVLTAAGVVLAQRRALIAVSIGVILCFGVWGSTYGRPKVNLSSKEGYEEGRWGYDALAANRDQEAARWLKDAVVYQPKLAVYWYDLGIAYDRLGNKASAHAAYQRAHQLEPTDAEYSAATDEAANSQQ